MDQKIYIKQFIDFPRFMNKGGIDRQDITNRKISNKYNNKNEEMRKKNFKAINIIYNFIIALY